MGYGDGRVVEIEAGQKLAYSSNGLVESGVIKAKKGTLLGIMGYNNSGSDQFIQIFNSPTVPADTTVPEITFKVLKSSSFSVSFGENGYPLKDGISWSNSSTLDTKTIGLANIWLNAIYN